MQTSAQYEMYFEKTNPLIAIVMKKLWKRLASYMEIISVYDEVSRKSIRYCIIHPNFWKNELSCGLWVLKEIRFPNNKINSSLYLNSPRYITLNYGVDYIGISNDIACIKYSISIALYSAKYLSVPLHSSP